MRLRYRVNGVLEDITFFEFSLQKNITSRLKLLAGLKLTEGLTLGEREGLILGDTEGERETLGLIDGLKLGENEGLKDGDKLTRVS